MHFRHRQHEMYILHLALKTFTKTSRLPNTASIFKAELYAILLAIVLYTLKSILVPIVIAPLYNIDLTIINSCFIVVCICLLFFYY